jgi:hypothetical protein
VDLPYDYENTSVPGFASLKKKEDAPDESYVYTHISMDARAV